jgi:hypothetical protein
MNDREFSDSEIFERSRKEYRCLCAYYVINTYASLMYELKKMERYLRLNLLGPGPSSYKKIICRAAVSQRLGNTALEDGLYKEEKLELLVIICSELQRIW